jgi:hypothetical protein
VNTHGAFFCARKVGCAFGYVVRNETKHRFDETLFPQRRKNPETGLA